MQIYKENFVNGEVSPLVLARTGIQQYYNAVELARNVELQPQGGVRARSGSLFVDKAEELLLGGQSKSRFVEFRFSNEQKYLFVFTDEKVEIFKDDVSQAVLTTPYTFDDIRPKFDANGNMVHSGIYVVSDLDTMFVFHEDFAPRRIQRQGSHTSWAIAEFTFDNIPRYEFTDGTYGAAYTPSSSSHPFGTGANAANLIDDDDATTSTNSTPDFSSTGNLKDRRIFQVDLGSSKAVGAVTVRNVSANADRSMTLLLSPDGTNWTQTGAVIEITSTSVTRTFVTRDVTARYVALVAEQAGNATWTVGEIDVYSDDVGVNEVQSISFPDTSVKTWTEGDTISLLVRDLETDSFAYSANAAEMAERIAYAIEKLPISSRTGNSAAVSIDYTNSSTPSATFTITFQEALGHLPIGSIFVNVIASEIAAVVFKVEVITPGRAPGERVFSSTRGYPRCGLVYQNRMWVAGLKSLPQFLLATRSNTLNDFNTGTTDDDYGIMLGLDTEDVPVILDMEAGRHLQIFTSSGEFYVPISEVDALTPTNIVARRTSEHGIQAGLKVFDVAGGTVFVQQGGNALREFLFADVELAYQAKNISLLASHLINDPVAIALRRSTSTEDADYAYIVNSDGTMTVFCTLRDENVNGYSLWTTDGQFYDVAVVGSDVYLGVIRDIDGTDTLMIEKLDETCWLDCAKMGGVASSVAFSHLGATETVDIVLDGRNQKQSAVSGGTVTFARASTASYQVGKKWPDVHADYPGFIWLVKTLPIEAETRRGSMHGRKRRIREITLRLYQTTALQVNDDALTFDKFGSSLLDAAGPSFTGLERIRGMLGWDLEGSVVIGSKVPGRATVLGISMGVAG